MELFYRKYGEGQPLIILHGLFGLSDNWVTIGKKIAENNFCVYIPDLRNHGNSPHSDEFNYKILSDDLNDFIKLHSIVSPVIIGHSMGGRVAMNFALNYTDKISKLVIVDIGIKEYEHNDLEIIDAIKEVDIKSILSRKEIEKQLSGKITDQQLRQLFMKNLKRKDDSQFEWKFNINSIKKNFNSIFIKLSCEKPFSGQTLFICGELSNYIMDKDTPEIKELFPTAIFEKIPYASHWVHADNPEEFYEVVLKFIEESKNVEKLI